MRRHIVIGLAALVLASGVWPTPAVAQGVGDWFSRLLGTKSIEQTHYWSGNNIGVEVTWSETSAKADEGKVITTVRLMITNRSEDTVFKIVSYTIGLNNDEDLQLATYSKTMAVLVNPGETRRYDFQFPLLPGLISYADSIQASLSWQECYKDGSHCFAPAP